MNEEDRKKLEAAIKNNDLAGLHTLADRAIEENDLAFFKAAVEGLNSLGKLNTPSNEGTTVLMKAAKNAEAAFVSFLMQFENLNLNIVNNEGDSALFLALVARNFNVVKLLLSDKRVNPMLPDNLGETPLIWARSRALEELIPFLKKAESEHTEKQDMKLFKEEMSLLTETGHFLGSDLEVTMQRPDNGRSFKKRMSGNKSLGSSMMITEKLGAYVDNLEKELEALRKRSENKEKEATGGTKEIKESKEIKDNKDRKENDRHENKENNGSTESKEISEKRVSVERFRMIHDAFTKEAQYLHFDRPRKEGIEQWIKSLESSDSQHLPRLVIVPGGNKNHDVGVAFCIGKSETYVIYANCGDHNNIPLGTHIFKLKQEIKISPESIMNLWQPEGNSIAAIEKTILALVERTPVMTTPAKKQRRKTCSTSNRKRLVEGALSAFEFMNGKPKNVALKYAELDYKKMTAYFRDNQTDKVLLEHSKATGQHKTFLTNLLKSILQEHHAAPKTPNLEEKPRLHVPRGVKIRNELKRERKILEALLQNLQQNQKEAILKDIENNTPQGLLLPAIRNNDGALAIYLIQNGADVLRKDGNNNTALILATQYGMAEVVQLLLKDSRVNRNARNNHQKTALDYALQGAAYNENDAMIAKMLAVDLKNEEEKKQKENKEEENWFREDKKQVKDKKRFMGNETTSEEQKSQTENKKRYDS